MRLAPVVVKVPVAVVENFVRDRNHKLFGIPKMYKLFVIGIPKIYKFVFPLAPVAGSIASSSMSVPVYKFQWLDRFRFRFRFPFPFTDSNRLIA